NKNMCLRMPLYVRCRLEHVPFVADLQSRVGRNAQSVTHEERQFNESVIALGHSTLIAVPIHLPKSQVALLLWVGARPISELRLLLDHVGPDLLAAGHYFMRAFARQHGQNGRTMEELSRLTPREWDCLRMTAQGYREAEVAKLEGIGATTVRYHLDNAVKKLGVANRTQAIARAVQLGMLGAIGE
ncbi:MAG: LuxR C-terminal-related transcriptional regulator, partial [Hyphomonadaceae bacterium]